MDMIEKVEAAIMDTFGESAEVQRLELQHGILTVEGSVEIANLARAVIEALREPAEEMLEAGVERLDFNDYTGPEADAYNRKTAGLVFTAMIDAALVQR